MGIGRNLVSLGAMVLLLGLAKAKHWKVTGKGEIGKFQTEALARLRSQRFIHT